MKSPAELSLLLIALCASGAGFGCGKGSNKGQTAPTAFVDRQGDQDMNRFRNPTTADIPQLIGLWKSADSNDRQDAILALGTVGSPECIPSVNEALADDDEYVRSYAMMGIGRALDGGRASPEFLQAVFPALAKLLNRSDRSVSGDAPKLLLAIDRDRAIVALLSKEVFTIQNPQLRFILEAFNQVEHRVPHEKLLPLLAELRPLSGKYPHSYQFRAALVAYAHNPDTAAERLFHESLKSSEAEVCEGAAQALCVYHGVKRPYRAAAEQEEKVGFENLVTPLQNYLAVSACDAQVNNGGLHQYFWNSSGNTWKSALAGLREIGAEKRAAVLDESTKLFGPNGPAEDRSLRQRQLAAVTESELDDLSTRYYACKDENVGMLLLLYAIKNKEHFNEQTSAHKPN